MRKRTLIALIYCLTLAVSALWLLLEHRASAQLLQENTALLRRLNEATEKLAENQRLPDPAPPSTDYSSETAAPLPASPASPDKQLLLVRSELAGLIQQHHQAESLREDTRQARASLDSRKKQDRAARRAASGGAPQLEVIKAEYWTDHTRMDVTDELQDRVRGDALKAMANNNIKGDPEFGQTKHLTIEYRLGGVTRTNEFREGDVIILPAE